ncbi:MULTISPECIES: fic family toxin-antitoxin system, toxin component [unclassified Streptomyces]|uniref:fic family toxin-antitoxin system, toxin component n=1 Tax=unclassified Streptomyces TaxID=2593676 RepID=UPI0023656503|nr:MULTISPECIES: fic family toxin-antitoxin system, toxin component [unclassified Streptomyces]MDF3144160.1 fic family toxin-antitoxin system, toxin component [Streptomyces sp. T21Q-yed]WDF45087.1 fic family toxin-antitoxin system, toxin component [Streptomyces sp. T12]
MPFVLFIDERWLLDVAQNLVPGDPDITDYGALAAAVARHQHEVMGTLVYPAPHHRAAALLHSLARIPALEHSNELFAAQVAYAYLHASGVQVKVSSRDAIALVENVVAGRRDVRQVAEELRNWG